MLFGSPSLEKAESEYGDGVFSSAGHSPRSAQVGKEILLKAPVISWVRRTAGIARVRLSLLGRFGSNDLGHQKWIKSGLSVSLKSIKLRVVVALAGEK